MSVKISGVLRGSPFKGHVKKGDLLLKLNNQEIRDFFDYQFYMDTNSMQSVVFSRNGSEFTLTAPQGAELKLIFESFIMDEQKRCRNDCVFCFIDQLPPGLRKSLYFKDDDSRLSFLFGNYITLTNLSADDIERVIKMRISPMNISVHTTNPELRMKMMRSKNAGESLKFLPLLASAGIKMNFQIVVCRGINDGAELERTLADLKSLYPATESIAVVPVGLTSHRDKLPKIKQFDSESALKVLQSVEKFGDACQNELGDRLVYPSDELFITARRTIPPFEYYKDFPQIENGVGLTQRFMHDFLEAMKTLRRRRRKETTIITGMLFADILRNLLRPFQEKFSCSINIIAAENRLFGNSVTVTGLLAASDIEAALVGVQHNGPVLIPDCMLNASGEMFLDDVTLRELSRKLKEKIICVGSGGAELAKALFK